MHTLQYAQKTIKKSIHFLTNSTKNYILGLLITTGKKIVLPCQQLVLVQFI